MYAAPATFADSTPLLGPLGNQLSWGVGWVDMDGDGWPDAFLSNHYGRTPYALRNLSGISFSDVATSSGLAVRTDYHSCKWGDYDRDSDWDLYCTVGQDYGTAQNPALLFRNRGDGTFQDVAASTATAFAGGRGRTVSWLDIDKDGDLDLFVGTRVDNESDPKSRLFRNDGAVFTDITSTAGIDLNRPVHTSLAFDYDEDGDTDLLISVWPRTGVSVPCSTSCLVFLRNDGGGAFTTISAQTLGIYGGWQRAVALGDYDNDGDLDIFQGNGTPSARLHRNNGNQTFTQVTLSAVGLSSVADYPVVGAQWGDFDNDGFLDLYVVRNHSDGSNAPNMLFLNNGDGTFRDGTEQFKAAGLAEGSGDAAAIVDYDRNGFLDLLVSNGFIGTNGPYQLLRNEGNGNYWLRVLPTDARGSPEFGSKVWLQSGGIQQFREYGDTSSHSSSNEPVVHFGLGAQSFAEIVRVQWPDGSTSELQNVSANQLIEIQKPDKTSVLASVPSVVGLTQAAATTAIADAGLVLGTVTQQSSATVAAGSVISQNPLAGTSVALGSAVSLVVSSGPATASVPATPVMNPATLLAKTVTLSWSNVADETGYDIGFANYNTRRQACGALSILKTVGTDVTATTDTRNGGGTYCYAVRAFNAAGASKWSNIEQVTVAKK